MLKQKKMYEKQRDTLYNQSFNVDQTRFALQNVKGQCSRPTCSQAVVMSRMLPLLGTVHAHGDAFVHAPFVRLLAGY